MTYAAASDSSPYAHSLTYSLLMCASIISCPAGLTYYINSLDLHPVGGRQATIREACARHAGGMSARPTQPLLTTLSPTGRVFPPEAPCPYGAEKRMKIEQNMHYRIHFRYFRRKDGEPTHSMLFSLGASARRNDGKQDEDSFSCGQTAFVRSVLRRGRLNRAPRRKWFTISFVRGRFGGGFHGTVAIAGGHDGSSFKEC
jgi:hypothetical protein